MRRRAQPGGDSVKASVDTKPESASLSNDVPLLLTIREAAKLLGRPERILYRWASEGRLPGARRVGRALYVARPELMAWLGKADADAQGPETIRARPV